MRDFVIWQSDFFVMHRIRNCSHTPSMLRVPHLAGLEITLAKWRKIRVIGRVISALIPLRGLFFLATRQKAQALSALVPRRQLRIGFGTAHIRQVCCAFLTSQALKSLLPNGEISYWQEPCQ